jgi:hypothetical protein
MTSSSRPISTSTLTSACACYNSGLFDFRKDTVTPSLKIDDKLLSDILSELYPPKSPYEFSVIANSVHSSWSIVPGTGDRKPGTKNREPGTDEVIRLTAGHQAKVEEKPEVSKAGEPQPVRLTNVCRCSKMQSMSAQGHSAVTDAGNRLASPQSPLSHRDRGES